MENINYEEQYDKLTTELSKILINDIDEFEGMKFWDKLGFYFLRIFMAIVTPKNIYTDRTVYQIRKRLYENMKETYKNEY
jgi:hypothetical protein